MKKFCRFAAALVLPAIVLVLFPGSGATQQAADPNLTPRISPPDVPNSAVTMLDVPRGLLPSVEAATPDGGTPAGPIVAIATMPAPSKSFDIRITLTNLSRFSTLGDQGIKAAIVDCFQAFDGQGLTIESVFD